MFLWFEDIENENFNLSMLRFTKFIFDLISSPFILNCETSTTAVYLRGKVDFGDWRTFVWIVGRCLIILSTIWKVSKYGAISGPYFPVFALNTEKYGPEITPYLDTFHAVINVYFIFENSKKCLQKTKLFPAKGDHKRSNTTKTDKS